ncbi:MAG: hypothetical protein VW757_00495 [Halieaceae bacterium]|jgi:flagellar biosynthesis chaperone FliJ|nr:hypothetical protein [Cellvibrionales bacterium]
MATKWDPLVLKYRRRSQQELNQLIALRHQLKEMECNRDKISERQQYFRHRLSMNSKQEIGDWRVMKAFLADLDFLRNNCEGQLIELRGLLKRAQSENEKTLQVLQKYEHLQQQTVRSRRSQQERNELDAIDEWAVQSHTRSNLARDLL